MRPVQVLLHQVVPDGFLAGVAKHGDGVRVVRRDRDLAVVPGRVRLHEVFGEAVEVGRCDANRTNVLADVLVELLSDRRDLVSQRFHLGPRSVVAVHAGQVEIPEDLRYRVAGGLRFERDVERGEGIKQLAVQAQFRGEAIRLLKRFVSRLAHRGIRMDVEEELRLGEQLFEPTGQLVERRERVLNRPCTRDVDDLPKEFAARRQVLLEHTVELRRRLREQKFRRRESSGFGLRFRQRAHLEGNRAPGALNFAVDRHSCGRGIRGRAERFSRKNPMDRAMADPVVRARDLWKSYDGRADVLCGVDLDVAASEAVLVFGPNGSGKTTLLSLLGGLDVPSRGSVAIGGKEISRLKESALAKIRLHDLGFVFQTHNLIDDLTVEENVALPLRLARKPADARVADLLQTFDLVRLATRRPNEISVGEAQRVAVARALANGPKVILADEPTAALDTKGTAAVLAAFELAREDFHAAVVVASHEPALPGFAGTSYHLEEGTLGRRG